MSILLDSLRKSEAQRKIGDAPSIYSTEELKGADTSGSGWVIWLLIGLTAAAITWFGWQQFGVFDSSEPVAMTDSQTPAATTTPEPEPVVGQGVVAEETPAQRTPVEQFSSPGEPGGPGQAASNPASRVADYVAEQPPEAAQTSGNEEDLQEQAAAASQDLEVSLDQVVAEQAEAQARVANNRTSESAASRRNSRFLNRDEEEQPQSYWQLPQSVRDDMPEFRITVLVFSEAPEDRFLLMNGERFREEDELEGGVVLEEIRRDGAVFAYGSRRFLVRN